MSLVNLKGGFHVSLRVEQSGSSEVTCMLKNVFLKDSSKWSMQLTDFFMNKASSIQRDLTNQLEIHNLNAGNMDTHYSPEDYIFEAKNCFTVCEYVRQLQEFFNRFSFRFWKVGVANILPNGLDGGHIHLDDAARANTPVNYTKRNFMEVPTAAGGLAWVDQGYGAVVNGLEVYPRICSVSLTNEMKLEFLFTRVFLSQFYVSISDSLKDILEFPSSNLFFIQHAPAPDEDDDIVSPADLPHLLANAIVARNWATVSKVFVTGYSISALDTRLSLDVSSVFPASRKLSIENGKEKHEYLLARFDLTNEKLFESTSRQNQDGMITGTEISETFSSGLVNLTRGNMDFEANYLLPGQIQQITLKLWTRYMEEGKIEYYPAKLDDGYFHTRMLFSKKV